VRSIANVTDAVAMGDLAHNIETEDVYFGGPVECVRERGDARGWVHRAFWVGRQELKVCKAPVSIILLSPLQGENNVIAHTL
jgi:hypothetical protein